MTSSVSNHNTRPGSFQRRIFLIFIIHDQRRNPRTRTPLSPCPMARSGQSRSSPDDDGIYLQGLRPACSAANPDGRGEISAEVPGEIGCGGSLDDFLGFTIFKRWFMCVGTGDRRDAGLMIMAWGIHANRAQCGSRIQSIHEAPGDLQI